VDAVIDHKSFLGDCGRQFLKDLKTWTRNFGLLHAEIVGGIDYVFRNLKRIEELFKRQKLGFKDIAEHGRMC
jgi:hypothetical protein